VEDLSEAELKTVLIWCDLNVPLNAGLEITDETRITLSIPALKYLCEKGAKLLLGPVEREHGGEALAGPRGQAYG